MLHSVLSIWESFYSILLSDYRKPVSPRMIYRYMTGDWSDLMWLNSQDHLCRTLNQFLITTFSLNSVEQGPYCGNLPVMCAETNLLFVDMCVKCTCLLGSDIPGLPILSSGIHKNLGHILPESQRIPLYLDGNTPGSPSTELNAV